MMPGKLYGIGIGPGDPELVTIKALNLLKSADVIFVPQGDRTEDSIALSILHKLLPGKNCLSVTFPMVRDPEQLREHWGAAAGIVAEKLARGLKVAFITLGDPLLYSTYIYLVRALAEKMPEIEVETIPGINSFSAAAALVNLPLLEREQKLAVLPASAPAEVLRQTLQEFDTVVLMKIGRRLARVRQLLQELGMAQDAVLVSRAGLEGQFVARDISKVDGERAGYLSVIIVRRKEGRA